MSEKVLFINGSYHQNGNTHKIIEKKREKLKFLGIESEEFFISNNASKCNDCHGCGHCQKNENEENLIDINVARNCIFKDDIMTLAEMLLSRNYSEVYFCTPVYTNTPTSKIVSLLHRLSAINDSCGKNVFEHMKANIIVTTGRSGSQLVGAILLSSLNMLSFQLGNRCIDYHIEMSKNNKEVRGKETYYID